MNAKRRRWRPTKKCAIFAYDFPLSSVPVCFPLKQVKSDHCCSEASKQHNEQRLKVLGTKQRLIKDVFQAAKEALKKTAAGSGYAELVSDLLVQVRS